MDKWAIKRAIREHPDAAAETLYAIQTGTRRLTADVIDLVARRERRDPHEIWYEQLQGRLLVIPFVTGMRARGVMFPKDVLADAEGDIPPDRLGPFLARAKSFRCRIRKNGRFAGTGVLVGPSLVLTAWHVIAVDRPGRPQKPVPKLEVRLADGEWYDARLPAAFHSECGDDEYGDGKGIVQRAPRDEAEVAGRHDVALLELTRPSSAYLRYAPLATPAPSPRRRGRVVVVHSPGGVDAVGLGHLAEIANVPSRWRYDVPTKRGSSGGACFDSDLHLIGIHQGALDGEARFVPADHFLGQIAERIRRDLAHPSLWSLDGTADGPLVIGRQAFFEAVAAVGGNDSRVRGVRLKWTGRTPPIGLSYSYDILQQLLIRRGPEHLLVRIVQDDIVDDMTEGIRRMVAHSGLMLPPPPDGPASPDDEQPPEITAKLRAENLVAALESAAAAAAVTAWIFIDDPAIVITESRRLVLESFVAAALRQPHLRLVLAGMNDFAFDGAEFVEPPEESADPSPGLMVEYLRPFRRVDVVEFLAVAASSLAVDIAPDIIEWEADRALVGLERFNHFYDPSLLATVVERVRPALQLFGPGVHLNPVRT